MTIDERPIVTGVELIVEPGELVALVAPNGSGKSTLLRTVYRALRQPPAWFHSTGTTCGG